MVCGERFVLFKGTPELHWHPRQLQFPGHHQAIAAVVARTHQHQHPPLAQPWGGQQPLGYAQAGFLHQRCHR